MLMLHLTTDPELFGLDAPGPALDGGGWCCFLHIFKPLRSGNSEELFIVAPLPGHRWRWRSFSSATCSLTNLRYFKGSATSPELTNDIAEISSNQHPKSSQNGLSLEPELFEPLATVLTTTPRRHVLLAIFGACWR
jgi:hypothetical protein